MVSGHKNKWYFIYAYMKNIASIIKERTRSKNKYIQISYTEY